MTSRSTDRLTAPEVARRLGIKVPTVYAYVSRGYLRSERTPNGRASTFDPLQVERLARRGRPRRSTRSPVVEIEVSTSITDVRDGHLRFRGVDAVELSRCATFEAVAELLILGEMPDLDRTWPTAHADAAILGIESIEGTNLDRLRLAVAIDAAAIAAAGTDVSSDLSPAAVAATGRRLIAATVAALPVRSRRAAPRLRLLSAAAGTTAPRTSAVRGTIAAQLAVRLGPRPVDGALVGMVNAALCLLADHELAASTLAARVAASARADPYGVVSAGLGPFSGTLHGTASRHVRTMLDRATHIGAPLAIAEALQQHRHVPGFGHPLYPHGDPRSSELMDRLQQQWPDRAGTDTVRLVLSSAMERTLLHPNIDFALGAVGHVGGLTPDAGDAIFGLARMAGWLAHAVEEYAETPLRFRPRARYIGPEPRAL